MVVITTELQIYYPARLLFRSFLEECELLRSIKEGKGHAPYAFPKGINGRADQLGCIYPRVLDDRTLFRCTYFKAICHQMTVQRFVDGGAPRASGADENEGSPLRERRLNDFVDLLLSWIFDMRKPRVGRGVRHCNYL